MRTRASVSVGTGLVGTVIFLGWVIFGNQAVRPVISSPVIVEAASHMPQLEVISPALPSAALRQSDIDRTIAAVQKYRLSSVLAHKNVLQEICRNDPGSLACGFLAERLVYEWLPMLDAYAVLRRAQLVEQKEGLAFIVQDRRGKGGRVVVPQSNLFREQARMFFEHQFEYYVGKEFGVSPSAPEAEYWERIPFYDFRFEGGYFLVTIKPGRGIEVQRFVAERTGGHFWLHQRNGKDPFLLPSKIHPKHKEIIERVIDGEMPLH